MTDGASKCGTVWGTVSCAIPILPHSRNSPETLKIHKIATQFEMCSVSHETLSSLHDKYISRLLCATPVKAS